MDSLRSSAHTLGRLTPVLAPIVLWAALWLSLGGGNASAITNPTSLVDFMHGLRSVFPFAAAGLATLVIIAKWPGQRPQIILFLGPLGLAALYGLVGLVASLLSPDSSTAIYWSVTYLSVPLVLWSVTRGADPLGVVHLLISFTWLGLILVAGSLFAIALIYMDMGEIIQHPAGFFRCQDAGHWFTLTSGMLRSTGVGRYAALAAIVAFTGLWQRRFPWLWGLVLLVSLMLLTTSGARTSLVGLAVAVGVVTLIYGGKKTAIGIMFGLAILLPLHFVSDFDETFLDNCILRSAVVLPPQERPASEIQTLLSSRVQASNQQQAEADIPQSSSSSVSSLTPNRPEPVTQTPAPQTLTNSRAPSENQIMLEPYIPQREAKGVSRLNRIVTLSGRTRVWEAGWEVFRDSPVLGRGFNADRLLLESHIHNAYLQALIQTGLIGTGFFVAALLWGWFLLVKTLRNLGRVPIVHKHVLVQVAALLAFLSVRSIAESSGAFFGVDWLLLALVFIYLQVMRQSFDVSKEPT